MKRKLLLIITAVVLLFLPKVNFGQAPPLGRDSSFVLFTAGGSFTNVGASYVTGDIGTYVGAYSAFPPGTLVGTSHIADSVAFYAAADIGTAYGFMSGITCDSVIGVTLGNSQVLTPRVFCLGAASTLNDTLFLNAQGNPNAIFIFKINGALSTSTHAHVILMNSASLCNVYWQINGQFTLGDSSVFRGNIIGSGAIILNTGSALYGRGLTTGGAISASAVIATKPSGCGGTSCTAPGITAQPVNHTACSGSSVGFSVTATGTSITYQWRKGTVNLTNTGNISGATSASLTINPVSISDTSSKYNVVITGACLPIANSANASLTLNTAPAITTQPSSQTACAGSSVGFSVTATGTSLTYQWRKGSVNLSNTGNITGATSASLTINPVSVSDAGANYNVIISGTCSPKDTSANVSLTLNTAPVITTQPSNQTICPAGSSVNFSVTATGTGLTYQWRKGSVSLTNGGKFSGATSASLTINPANSPDTASNYNVVITGTCTPVSTSVNASLKVNATIAITTAPANQTACAGSSTGFSVAAVGAGLTYQWRKGSVNLTNTGNITGATSAALTINPATISDAASNYNVIISGACAPNDTTTNVSLTVNTAPAITAQPTNQTACAGGSAGFSVTATGTALTYQWRKGTVNLTNGGHIAGATSATLTINPAGLSDTSSNYNVVITGTCLPGATSTNVSLTINTAPAFTAQPVNHTACAGSSAVFAVTATGGGLIYQWRKGSVNLSNAGNITGATSASLTINPVSSSDAAANYNVVITGTCSPGDTSANVSLTVNTAPVITTQPSSQTTCPGGSSVNFTVTATGTGLTYQWRKGTVNLTNVGKISGATSASLTINPANSSDTATNYNVVITGTCSPISTSVNVSLTVNATIVIISSSPNQTACAGSSAGFSVAAVGAGLTYQWRKGSVNLSNTGNITGATSATLIINPATISDAASNYNVIISGTCAPNDTSANVSLTVNTSPAITTQPADQTVCAGSSAGFSVTATGTGLTYQWRNGTVNLTNAGNITGATSATLTINPVNISDVSSNYNVVVSGTCSPNDVSANASLTINVAPAITTQPSHVEVCSGNSAGFSVVATGTGLTYQWRKGTVNLTNGGNISGATSATLTINPATLSDAASNYNVVITGTCSPVVVSANAPLTVNTAPEIIIEPVSQMASDSGSISYTVVATGSGLTYQWRRGTVNLTNAGNISGATSATLIIHPATFSDTAYNYNVVVTGTCSPNSISCNVSLLICVCNPTGIASVDAGNSNDAVAVYPNPFKTSMNIIINDASQLNNCELRLYNILGAEVMNTTVTKQLTTLETSHLPSGMYFYKVSVNNKTIQSGKLISQ